MSDTEWTGPRPWNTNHTGYRAIFTAALTGVMANPTFFGPHMQGEPMTAIQMADQTVLAAIGNKEAIDLWNGFEALHNALHAIQRYARSDGQRTFDDCIRDLERIDDICREALK